MVDGKEYNLTQHGFARNLEFYKKEDNLSLGINEKFECEHKIIVN